MKVKIGLRDVREHVHEGVVILRNYVWKTKASVAVAGISIEFTVTAWDGWL